MGWASGSEIANDMITCPAIQRLQDDERKPIFNTLYKSLRSMDWDTVDESMGIDPVFDEVVRENEPDWFDNEDDGVYD